MAVRAEGGLLLCTWWLALTCVADTSLTLADAQRLALARSRELVAQEAAAVAAQEMAVAAGQLPDPTLSLAVENLPVDGPDRYSLSRDFMTMRRIGLMQELTRREKRALRVERLERELALIDAEKIAAAIRIKREVALAWLERYYQEAMVALVADSIAAAKSEVDAAEAGYRGGHGTVAEVLAARSAVGALEDVASDVDRRLRAAKTVLARWVGEAAAAPLAEKPDIDRLAGDVPSLIAALDRHPELLVLRRQEAMADADARLAEANRHPDWSVELAYSQRGALYSNMVSLGVSVPLPWDRDRRQDREWAAKRALVDRVRSEWDEGRRARGAELRSLIDAWDSGRVRQVRYTQQLIPLARARSQATAAAYRGGRANLSEVLIARRNEIDVRMQALQLEMETALRWAELNFLLPDAAMPALEGNTADRPLRQEAP